MSGTNYQNHIGERFYWYEDSNRYIFPRSGILTGVYRGRLEFDDSGDYKFPKELRGLRTSESYVEAQA